MVVGLLLSNFSYCFGVFKDIHGVMPFNNENYYKANDVTPRLNLVLYGQEAPNVP